MRNHYEFGEKSDFGLSSIGETNPWMKLYIPQVKDLRNWGEIALKSVTQTGTLPSMESLVRERNFESLWVNYESE